MRVHPGDGDQSSLSADLLSMLDNQSELCNDKTVDCFKSSLFKPRCF